MKRRNEEPEKDEFIVLFTALSMILLAFFIMLNTMAVIDPARSREAMDSLVGTFGLMPGFTGGASGTSDQDTPPARKRVIDEVLTDIERGAHRGMSLKTREDGRPVIEMEGDVAFGPMRTRISPAHFEALDAIADAIARANYPVRVEGHSDARPPRGKRSNLYLSAARAASVQDYLVHASGAQPGLITAIGMGAARPHPEASSARDPRHRRVEIVFLIPDQVLVPDLTPEVSP